MWKFAAGDRAEFACLGGKREVGTIETVSDTHIRVRWDNGQISTVFFDNRPAPAPSAGEEK